jgi:plasmid stability protein
MAQVIVRRLNESVVATLKSRARRRGRSLEQELRDIVTAAAEPSRDEVLAAVDRVRAMTPRRLRSSSAKLIRAERDRGWR